MWRGATKEGAELLAQYSKTSDSGPSKVETYIAKNKRVTFNQIGLPQLQHQCQTMCIQADQLHCLISTGSKQLNHVQWSAVLLRTLFNIEAATCGNPISWKLPFVFAVHIICKTDRSTKDTFQGTEICDNWETFVFENLKLENLTEWEACPRPFVSLQNGVWSCVTKGKGFLLCWEKWGYPSLG